MLENIYVITDLGPGDGGKGGVVHALSCKTDASIIIKRGGAQGSHGVHTSSGEKFNFSQWGCGTLEAVPTFLSEQMVISPVGLNNEANALKHMGIYDPYVLLFVAPLCIVTTPFHRISSRLEELRLGDNPRGTIGTGVGKAYRMANEFGSELTLYAHELTNRDIVQQKLRKQLGYYRNLYKDYPTDNGCTNDICLIADNLNLLHDDGYLPYSVDLFTDVGQKLQFRQLDEIIKTYDGTAIVECSHGVLTDAETGLRPHVSAIRTLPKFANDMLRQAGYDKRIINLAVHRAYEIRHGAGPMPTYDSEFTKRMLPDSHKATNRWQGAVRAGPLDLNLIKYALETCHETPFDGICFTWFDQILATGQIWPVCKDYQNKDKVAKINTEFFETAKPLVQNYIFKDNITESELISLFEKFCNSNFLVPFCLLSVGPTELDKIYSDDFKRRFSI